MGHFAEIKVGLSDHMSCFSNIDLKDICHENEERERIFEKIQRSNRPLNLAFFNDIKGNL